MKADSRQDLRKRTSEYALRIINLYTVLPKRNPGQVIANQLLRSGTSVGANYAEGCRSRSDADFINKHEICLQEFEETAYWLELLTDAEIIKEERIQLLKEETKELLAIFTSIVRTTKNRIRKS